MRVLKRPMFRIGGSTNEGITSGLAPRQGYANGPGIVEQIQQKKNLFLMFPIGKEY